MRLCAFSKLELHTHMAAPNCCYMVGEAPEKRLDVQVGVRYKYVGSLTGVNRVKADESTDLGQEKPTGHPTVATKNVTVHRGFAGYPEEVYMLFLLEIFTFLYLCFVPRCHCFLM